jgi:hypothetical protein
MTEWCCKEMKQRIAKEDFEHGDFGVEIYGKPSYAYDGDGQYDDMTCTYPIVYCPFCGAKIQKEEVEATWQQQ